MCLESSPPPLSERLLDSQQGEEMRRKNDFYETPAGLTLALASGICVLPGALVADPCCGGNAILDVLNVIRPDLELFGSDIDPTKSMVPLDMTNEDHADSFLGTGNNPHFDHIITNVPFSEQDVMVPILTARARISAHILVRVSYVEPTKGRSAQMTLAPPHSQLSFGMPRPSFSGDGNTDSVTVAWYSWYRDANMVHKYPIDAASNWEATNGRRHKGGQYNLEAFRRASRLSYEAAGSAALYRRYDRLVGGFR